MEIYLIIGLVLLAVAAVYLFFWWRKLEKQEARVQAFLNATPVLQSTTLDVHELKYEETYDNGAFKALLEDEEGGGKFREILAVDIAQEFAEQLVRENFVKLQVVNLPREPYQKEATKIQVVASLKAVKYDD